MRALIVGCGRIAGGYNELNERGVFSHVIAWRRLGVEIAGCVDSDATRARDFAARWGIASHGNDLGRMLTVIAPDIVSDCTPPVARVAVTGAALASPSVRAVLCEKPLTATAKSARGLIAQSRRSGVPLIVNHQRAFDPCYRDVADLIDRGAIGRLQWINAMAYGGALTNMSHVVERAIALCGRIEAAWQIAPQRPADPDDPALFFAARFANSAEGVFLPVVRDGIALIELDLIGTEGRIRVLDSDRRVELFRAKEDAESSLRSLELVEPCPIAAPDHEALLRAAEAALAAARGDGWDESLPERAADTVAVLEALRLHGRFEARLAA